MTALTRLAAASRTAGTGVAIRAEDFDEIVRQHQRRIYGILMSLLRDPDAADSLTQECFLRAYQKRASFRGDASLGTWLIRIAVNLAADHRKNQRRTFWSRLLPWRVDEDSGSAAPEVPDPQPSAERVLLASEELAAVWDTVDRLPAQQRTVFLLRFAEELTLQEIAQAMELDIGTVKAHLHRAVGAIRVRLGGKSKR